MTDGTEFKNFSTDSSTSLSPRALESIHQKIQNSLPAVSEVFWKLTLIHLIASIASLVVCPQFGVRLLFDSHQHSLLDVFMETGHYGCYFFCGVFYLGSSFLLAKVILNVDHWVIIRRTKFLFVSSLALISMGALSFFSHEMQFELAVIWFLGAYLGGSLLTKDWWKLRLGQQVHRS